MKRTKEERLARLKNYRTRYEVVLTNGTDKYLVLYTSRRSKMGLCLAVQQRSDAVSLITNGINPWLSKRGDTSHPGEWSVLFSGRTQREAITDGELPFASAQVAQEAEA